MKKMLHPNHFGDRYKQKMEYGFDWIIEYANNLNPNLVIDAGCGRNMYKGKIQNLIGFDSGDYSNADFNSTILDAVFEPESADIVMALGSVQFVSLKYIRKNLEKIVSWVKPNGHLIMRTTKKDDNILKGIRHRNYVKIVPWPDGFLEEMTEKLNLEIVLDPTSNTVAYRGGLEMEKISWVWKKKDV